MNGPDPLLHGEIVDEAGLVDEREMSLEAQLIASAPALARVAGGVW